MADYNYYFVLFICFAALFTISEVLDMIPETYLAPGSISAVVVTSIKKIIKKLLQTPPPPPELPPV